MPLIFSYGSLQNERVQRATFGRTLRGEPDALERYERTEVRGLANVTLSGGSEARVEGTAFEITDAELEVADAYESRDAYRRIAVTLASGKHAWVYIDSRGRV